MSAQFGSILGEQAQGLYFHAQRAELLAANIANAETPGYRARDVDFRSALRAASADRLAQSHSQHMPSNSNFNTSVHYRQPAQSSINGNTVDMPMEQTAYAENALRYQVNLRFLDGKIKSLMLALRGD
ncbi:MAG: flagellar basal body rod protein FlgB [Gammaproteobacteria bacterium]|nr:flagellar basal body rod protein FlgB [Gammaproteobacteria bacterium]MBQ0839504.1 flagellar basal body rod protein FlgB [Gammaproteobacteria bacterium]